MARHNAGMTTSRIATYDLRVDFSHDFGDFAVVQVEATSSVEALGLGYKLHPDAIGITALCARFAPDAATIGGIRMLAA